MVLDFGNAYVLDEMGEATLTSSAVGSLGYIPSEVLANPRLRDYRQDVFAAAVITYEMIARKRPDPQSYQPLHVLFSDVHPLIDIVLARALGAAQSRPGSAEEFREQLLSASPPARL